MLNAEQIALRAKWVSALRSGSYEQTTGQLRLQVTDPTACGLKPGYCCLGVLADVLAKEQPEVYKFEPEGKNLGYENFCLSNKYNADDPQADVSSGTLTQRAMDAVGLNQASGGLTTGQLITANDSYGKTFDAIAQMIEDDTAYHLTLANESGD